ncbi:HAD-IIB family hydrolase [Acetobacterium bakii]|uniref:Hydrolase n=1 Tax=Acetobacterium bakii TaxID=52689 RepID=A0A0L6U267_9FIRM|nr:HAD-IIB family hydrolase [Acetobacterium bakii]KNZ42619.1 hydrolase [Acetobacterium bakii]
MPKIGMRIIKTCIAVYICFLIYLLRGEQGAPFYSAIAAILCMQPYVSNSFKIALNRTVGTFIGGAMGLVFLIVERSLALTSIPALQYLMVSLAIIPLIYITLLIKKPTASYIACVVFLSIAITHGSDVNPALFTMDRILDTLIGIFVSLGVNAFHLPRKKNTHILFVSDLDGTLLNSQNAISNYSKIKLNKLLSQGALISIVTNRSIATLLPIFEGVELKLPLVLMNGAALYDLQKKKYVHCRTVSNSTAQQVLKVFKQQGTNCFTHTIINDMLHIYYIRLINPVEKELYHSKKLHPQKNYISGELPDDRDVLYIMAVDKLELIEKLREKIIGLSCAPEINVIIHGDKEHDGYYYLEIYSAEVSVKKAIVEMQERLSADTLVAFGDNESDIPLLEMADHGYAVANATDGLMEMEPIIIGDNNSDAVVKTIEKHFYSKRKGAQTFES